jgi:hypothetical protein
MKSSFIILSFLFLCLLSAPAIGKDNVEKPWLHKVIFGLFLHDRGFASDRHESGVDPNWELQFNAPDWKLWRWIGSPVPMAGLTPNFKGDTSVFYGGINYEFSLSNRFTDPLTFNLTKTLFVAGGLSAAIHNGPLHKNPIGCRERSDCGFGYRVLPRVDIELGTNFWKNHGVSLFWDHMSHKGSLGGENEGIDHIGIRYHFTFDKPQP